MSHSISPSDTSGPQRDDKLRTMQELVASASWPSVNDYRTLLRLAHDWKHNQKGWENQLSQFARDVMWPALKRASIDLDDSFIVPRYHLTEFFKDALEQLPPDARSSMFDRLSPWLLSSIRNPQDNAHKDALIALVSAIGLRSEQLEVALIEVLSQSEDTNCSVLTLLAQLGIPEQHRGVIGHRVQHFVSRHSLLESSNIVHSLAGQNWLTDQVADALLDRVQVESTSYVNWPDASLALTILQHIAFSQRKNPIRQSQVWQLIQTCHKNATETFGPALELSSAACTAFDDSRVIPDLIGWYFRRCGGDTKSANIRFRLYLRLLESTLPNVIEGWGTAVSINADAFQVISADATRDTGSTSTWVTTDHQVKEYAWEVLMCASYRGISDIAPRAVSFETNPFVAQNVYQRLSQWPGLPLSEYDKSLILDKFDSSDTKDKGELCRRLGAIEFAASSAKWEAFNALLHTRVTSNGAIYTSTGDIFASVAHNLVKDYPRLVVERLFMALESHSAIQQELSSYAFRQLASLGVNLLAHCDDLWKTVKCGRLSEWSAEALIEAIRFAKPQLSQSLQLEVLSVARGEVARIQQAALDLLVEVADEDLLELEVLCPLLNLAVNGQEWNLASDLRHERLEFTYGLLYRRFPARAAQVVCKLLEMGDAGTIFALFGALGDVGADTPREVQQAAVARVLYRTSQGYLERDFIRLAARISAKLMASTNWLQSIDQWHPEARVAIAEAMGKYRTTDVNGVDVLRTLIGLAGDGRYEVRRAAMRSIASISADAISELCQTWSESADVDFRRRAAEGCVWVQPINDTVPMLDRLRIDLDPSVRAAAHRAIQERTEREISSKYVQIIHRGLLQGEDVPSLYRFGVALRQLGDDGDAAALDEWLSTMALLPHQRLWLLRLQKDIYQRWKDATSKWPQPWLRMDGIVEIVEGTLSVAGKDYSIRATLWMNQRKTGPRLKGWGALIDFKNRISVFPIGIQAVRSDDLSLSLVGRKSVRVIYRSGFGQESILVTGSAEYPDKYELTQ